MVRMRWLLLFVLVFAGALAAKADAGWGRGRHRGWSGAVGCADCGGAYGGGPHWVNSYFHGHRLVRFWGGPNHPIPPLSGPPGFWDQPGWFSHDPYMANMSVTSGQAAPAAATSSAPAGEAEDEKQ